MVTGRVDDCLVSAGSAVGVDRGNGGGVVCGIRPNVVLLWGKGGGEGRIPIAGGGAGIAGGAACSIRCCAMRSPTLRAMRFTAMRKAAAFMLELVSMHKNPLGTRLVCRAWSPNSSTKKSR